MLLLLSAPVYAGGPYGFEDSKLNREFEQNYYEHNYPKWVNATGSSLTVSYINTSSLTITSGLNIASGTITNFTATSSTMTFLKVSSTTIIPWMTDWKADLTFTPNSWGTISGSDFKYRRVGDTMEVRFSFKAGTVAAAAASIDLPTGFAFAPLKVAASVDNSAPVGSFNLATTAGGQGTYTDLVGGVLIVQPAGTQNRILFAARANTIASDNAVATINASSLASNSATVIGYFSVPILGWGTGN